MSLYPSLEDMKVDQIMRQQQNAFDQILNQPAIPAYTANPYPEMGSGNIDPKMYPDLVDFMGMELSKDVIAANMPEYLRDHQVALPQNSSVSPYSAPQPHLSGMVAPLSGTSVGLQRAQVTHGIRQLILCKGADKKVGIRVQAIDKGVFVCLVVKGSPAALGGLRFGDQILQINDQLVAGYSVDDVHKLLKKSSTNNISIVVRDRPFERTITMHKDHRGEVGFQFSGGKITAIVKDSSAARNGLLIDHYLLEVDGQNVVGMKDKDITKIIDGAPQIVTITILPKFIYDHMMHKLSSSWIRGIMDHSVPDI